MKSAGLTTAAGLTVNLAKKENQQGQMVPEGLTIVFQGDSITDAGRDRGNYYANQGRGMGTGYVHQIVSHLLGTLPEKGIKCYNRGISGHKVFQLADRWDIDCLNLQPDVLSILIGVNDYWHMLGGRYHGTAQIYETDLRALLKRTKTARPEVKIIMGEPFAVAGGSAIDDAWGPFDEYRIIAKKLAGEFDAAFLPFHQIFSDALKVAPVDYWCPDGVHPSIAGGHLMKKAWIEAFDKMM